MQIFQIAPSLQSANLTQSYSRSCDYIQVSRSVASHEAKAKLKIACLDSNTNFAVFTISKFAGIPKTKKFANKQTLLNSINFVLQNISKRGCSASKPLRIFNKNVIRFENFFGNTHSIADFACVFPVPHACLPNFFCGIQ